MKAISSLAAYFIILSILPLPVYSAVTFSDSFRGTTLDPDHWEIKKQNTTGWVTVTEDFLEINGGPVSPNNDSQGAFLHGKDGWSAAEEHTVRLTLLAPNVTTFSSKGVQSLVSWLWLSNGRPNSSSMTLSTNPAFLVKVSQGISEATYNKIEIYSKQATGTGQGTLLWSGLYSITDDPSLSITISIDSSTYEVSFNREMTSTTGNLSGEHGIVFTESLYANLGGSNAVTGRGETRFVDFSIAPAIPEPGPVVAMLIGAGAMAGVLWRRRAGRAGRSGLSR